MTERLSVTLTHQFNAPIELVFDAWTDASQVVQWMKCGDDVQLSYDGWVPTVGARFSSVMSKPGEWEVQGTGEITEVDRPNVFAYRQDANPAMKMPETDVRVVFEAVDGGTKLTLTHSGLPGEDMCGIVQGGWQGGMQQLEALLAAKG